MKPDDQELERLLRQVDVPGDLKSRLRQIADVDLAPSKPLASVELTGPAATDSAKWRWLLLTLAASLTGVALYFFWPTRHDFRDSVAVESPIDQSSFPGAEQNLPVELPEVVRGPRSTQILDEMAADASQLDQLILQMKIQRLSSQVRTLERKAFTGPVAVPNLPRLEQASMILSASNQSAISLGVDEPDARRNFAYVIENFPATRGAELAQQALVTKLN